MGLALTQPTPTAMPAQPGSGETVAVVRAKEPRSWRELLRGEGHDSIAARIDAGQDPPVPVWIELYLEIVEPDDGLAQLLYNWFEGSTDPWTPFERPKIDWGDDASKVLGDQHLTAPDPRIAHPGLATRALALLPHLYSLGVNRVRQELERKVETGAGPGSGNGSIAAANGHEPLAFDDIEMFPLIGFVRRPDRPGFSFDLLRTNVALLGDTMVTIRLPNLACPDDRRRPGRPPRELEEPHRATADPLDVPDRFFPCWEARSRDVAEEIARHQAATTRALSDSVREQLEVCADQHLYPPGSDPPRRPRPLPVRLGLRKPRPEDKDPLPIDDLHGKAMLEVERDRERVFTELAEIAEMAERQLARLLRRLGSYGEDDGGADVPRRYRYALDEIKTLETEITAARDRHSTRMTAESEAERSQFQNIVAFAGAAILIPTLVVGVFGANVWLPGKEDRSGLFAMLFFIFAFAGLGGLLVDGLQQRTWRLPGLWRRVVAGFAVAFAIAASIFLFWPTKHDEANSVPGETHGLIGDLLGRDIGAG